MPSLGGDVELTLPPGTQTGTTLRLRGYGMPSVRGTQRGDHHVTVYVVVPTKLNKRQRELLEEYAYAGGDAIEERTFFDRVKDAFRPGVTTRRFFVEGTREVGSIVEIEGGDAHKITRVLRLRAGDRIEIVDSAATAFVAAIADDGTVVRARLLEIDRGAQPTAKRRGSRRRRAGSPEGRRMDFVIEKGTELGAGAFIPFYCERSVRRERRSETTGALARLARTARKQCGRRDVPEVREPLRFDELAGAFSRLRGVLFAWELAPPAPLSERPARGFADIGARARCRWARRRIHTRRSRAPRGTTARSLFWLGPRILRTDTAALVLLAVIGALTS